MTNERPRVIGVMMPMDIPVMFADPWFTFIQSVWSICDIQKQAMLLWLDEPDYVRGRIHDFLYNGGLDGVIIAPLLVNEPLVQALIESPLPFILVGHSPARGGVNYVAIDNISGAYEAAQHLLRAGRRRLAAISGPPNTIAGSERLQGYAYALKEHGLHIEPEQIAYGEFSESGGYFAMRKLLPQRPEAVFVANDLMATGALRAIRTAGLRVPEDLALVAFDDASLAANADPPLTAIRQPICQLARLAVQTLLKLIETPGLAPQRIVLPTELVVRSSCGVPAAVVTT